jgi:hypothetical protein
MEIDSILQNMKVTRVDHLPIVAAFCRRIGLAETVNRVVPTHMEVDVGTVVQSMVLDTLSGRSPLYRLSDFFKHQDTDLLLGRHLPHTAFNDTTVGRAIGRHLQGGSRESL